MTYQPKVYRAQGGNKLVVANGGIVDLQDGATLNMANGYSADGHGMPRLARATWDFAEHGGAIGAKGLGVSLPAGAIIVGGFIDVVTTCETADADAGTMAISVEAANDIVAATAVSAVGDIWDEGRQAIIPKAHTPEATSVKCTQAREITATIAGKAFTAGKFIVFLHYVLSE